MIFPAQEKSNNGLGQSMPLPPLSFTGGAAGDAMSGAPVNFGSVNMDKSVPAWVWLAVIGLGSVVIYKKVLKK